MKTEHDQQHGYDFDSLVKREDTDPQRVLRMATYIMMWAAWQMHAMKDKQSNAYAELRHINTAATIIVYRSGGYELGTPYDALLKATEEGGAA